MEQFRRGGLTFDVRDKGPRDGEVVVLLHGFPQDASSWSLVEPLLNAAGYRTLAPDQRGYSPGARPLNRSEYSSAALRDDIIAMLDEAGVEKAHVVGHDWGGNVAWMVAGGYPERTRSMISVSTPHPSAMAKSWFGSTQLLRSWYILAFQFPFLPEFAISKGNIAGVLRKGGLSRESAQHSANLLAERNALRCTLNWYRGIPYSLKTSPHRTRVPVTYLWGKRDPYLGSVTAHLTRQFVAADYQFIEVDGGHWLPESHAEQVAEAIVVRARSVSHV